MAENHVFNSANLAPQFVQPSYTFAYFVGMDTDVKIYLNLTTEISFVFRPFDGVEMTKVERSGTPTGEGSYTFSTNKKIGYLYATVTTATPFKVYFT